MLCLAFACNGNRADTAPGEHLRSPDGRDAYIAAAATEDDASPRTGSTSSGSSGAGSSGARPTGDAPMPGIVENDGGPDSFVRFAVIGDYGLDSDYEEAVARLVTSWNPAFVITTGDNNYFSGSADTIDENIGKHYGRFIGNYKGVYGRGSPTNRFWPSAGNHDWGSPNLQAYRDYFTLPGNERYYDVDQGLVHLYAIDSFEADPDGTSMDSIQANWLKDRLSKSTACFDVVYFHYPPYSSGSFHGSTPGMRWPFEAWGTEVVMTGHEHFYERLQVGGIPYLTVGLGGASPYGFALPLSQSRFRYNGDFGALRVTADRHAIQFEFINVHNRVVDSFIQRKECP